MPVWRQDGKRPLEPWTLSSVRCKTRRLLRWLDKMARSAAPVGAEGADRAGSGGATSTPPVQAPVIASSSPPLGQLSADESKSIMASTKGFEASVRKSQIWPQAICHEHLPLRSYVVQGLQKKRLVQHFKPLQHTLSMGQPHHTRNITSKVHRQGRHTILSVHTQWSNEQTRTRTVPNKKSGTTMSGYFHNSDFLTQKRKHADVMRHRTETQKQVAQALYLNDCVRPTCREKHQYQPDCRRGQSCCCRCSQRRRKL